MNPLHNVTDSGLVFFHLGLRLQMFQRCNGFDVTDSRADVTDSVFERFSFAWAYVYRCFFTDVTESGRNDVTDSGFHRCNGFGFFLD